jgi:hypothetical protein
MRHFYRTFISLSVLLASTANAAIFDAPDYLEPGKVSVGALGEFLLNNPSGEGIEVRAKRGINDMVNVQPFIGFGKDNRRFRFGVAVPVNFFPNTESQPGVSMVLTGMYVRRDTFSGVNFSVAPMLHKVLQGANDLPLNLFLAFPLHVELFDGKYKTGLQAAFGGLYDLDRFDTYFLMSEINVSLNHAESSVVLGGGIRFGGGRENKATWKEEYVDPMVKKLSPDKSKTVDESEEYEPEE